MDIYDISDKGVIPGVLDERVRDGQKVQITRMVTFSYTVDMDDITYVLGKNDISVKELIELELDENGVLVNPDIVRIMANVDDRVIGVEIL